MHADISAAGLDVPLEDILLRRIQHVARRTQEDHGAVARQVFLRKGARVLRRVDRESILLAELPDGGDAVGDGAVTKSCCLREHEHPRLLCVCGDGDRDRGKERDGEKESVHGPICSAVLRTARIWCI